MNMFSITSFSEQKATGPLEIRTSQLTLRLVQKPYSRGGETSWQAGNEKIVLPDQQEIARVADSTIQLSMVAYRNMQVHLL
jgi:hypothetical protein